MASLSDARKLDIVFKILSSREETTTAKAWYEERPIKSRILHLSEIWADPIPDPPPASETTVVRPLMDYELTLDDTVANNKAWLVTKTPGDKNAPRYPLIHPRYGAGYAARIFGADGTEIPTTHPSKWFIIYEEGILVFEEDPTAHGIALPIKIRAYAYIGQTLDTVPSQSTDDGIKWAMIMS